jgi:hypothetical protein
MEPDRLIGLAPGELHITVIRGPDGFGMRVSSAAVVTGYTSVGSPAQLAGLPIGGRITKVNAVVVANKKEVVAQLQTSGDSNHVVFTIRSVVPEPEVEPPLQLKHLLELEPEPEPEISTLLGAEPDVELELQVRPEPEPETTTLPRLPLPQLSLLAATWHFFLSHMQTEARDLVKDLFSMMKENGCRAWLDMQAEKINRPRPRGAVTRRWPSV